MWLLATLIGEYMTMSFKGLPVRFIRIIGVFEVEKMYHVGHID